MVIFSRIRSLWIWSIISVLVMRQSWASTNGLEKFQSISIPCETKCECHSWIPVNGSQVYDGLTVNCIGWRFGFLQGLTLPPIQPKNTNLLYKDSDWGLDY